MAFDYRYDSKNVFGEFDLDRNLFVVRCEECGNVCGEGANHSDADEDAFCNDAHHERESGNTYCANCYQRLMDEAYAEYRAYAPIYRAEQALRDQLTREDDMLAQADMAFDAARDRGEI